MKRNQFVRIHGSKIQFGRRNAVETGTAGIWPGAYLGQYLPEEFSKKEIIRVSGIWLRLRQSPRR